MLEANTESVLDLAHEAFDFGPRNHYHPDNEAFWAMHAPVVEAWVDAMQAEGDLWWQSAAHAAFCLVSHREGEAESLCERPHWRAFDAERFLFHDLSEGGTVGFFGSVPNFFAQLIEAFERFTRAGIIRADLTGLWLNDLRASEPRFIDYYEWDENDESAERMTAGKTEESRPPRERMQYPSPVRVSRSPLDRRKLRRQRKTQRAARRRGRRAG